MNYLHRLEHWGEAHHSKSLDILRIALGLFLCFRGIEFARDPNGIMNLMTGNVPFSSFMLILVSHYIFFAHILGGFMLAMGMLTRFACLIQIPILIGAIIFVNTGTSSGLFSELFLSVLVLLLLIYFAIAGSGPWSFDWYLDKEKK